MSIPMVAFLVVCSQGMLLAAAANKEPVAPTPSALTQLQAFRFAPVRLAIEDLIHTHGRDYPQGSEYLNRWQSLEQQVRATTSHAQADDPMVAQLLTAAEQLQREALLDNPLLRSKSILMVKRKNRPLTATDKDNKIWYSKSPGADLGLPSNHECNSSVPRTGYDNELSVLQDVRDTGSLRTLYRAGQGGYVGEVDLHWDGQRLLFTRGDETNWKVFELATDGSGLRQVSRLQEDVDSFDACYLPNGKIVFGSTATYQSVPCWHGQKRVSNLYLMNADGSGVRQLCFDQDHDLHATVLPNGQVLYNRWDYTGINHIYQRELMLMNPDGSGQRAIYASGSWFPNALYFSRALPGEPGKIISIVSGYHGVHRMGQLVVIDTQHGWQEAAGMVQRISGRGDPITPIIRDNLVDADWPKFLHPQPISAKHFLVSVWMGPKAQWAIYLADIFDNLTLIRQEPGYALLEPTLLNKTPAPPAIPEAVDLRRDDGLVYIHNVYTGPGLKDVPVGTVKNLRVLAYHFGYLGLAGPDRIGFGGPWEVMRILGTVPVENDGSVFFKVPANTPISLQPLDGEGKAVQLMRSWMTVMPGETASCIGCHERPNETARPNLASAARKTPVELTPWHGPARGFDFEREVQPVLNRHCVSCHDGRDEQKPDLRPLKQVPSYAGRKISDLGIKRLHPKMLADTGGVLRYTPAYDALIGYLRRVSTEDDVSMLVPGEYHADTSPLIQMLRKGHHGARLKAEDWDRLVTWIDLNAPCHGTWGEVYPIPDGMHEKRLAAFKTYGGPKVDPEIIPQQNPAAGPLATPLGQVVTPAPAPPANPPGWPFAAGEAKRRQNALGQVTKRVDLGAGVTMQLVQIPSGEFLMGDVHGADDETNMTRVSIERSFWMAACETSNEQYRRFAPSHDPRYYGKRHATMDDQGLPLNSPPQPVVRVSWLDAMNYCRWLTQQTGLRFNLPTEAQWEWACRAGSAQALSFGEVTQDFSPCANLADQVFSKGLLKDGKQITGGLDHMVLEGADLAETRFNDKFVVTAPVGSFQANSWGLQDMHGNAAEWTRSTYREYPYREDAERADLTPAARKVVRGGSFFDPPRRSRSATRVSYPAWQKVFNVGFRVVCEDDVAVKHADSR